MDERLQAIKDQIDDMFDTEEGREALTDLAEFIETNLNNDSFDIRPL